VNGCRSGTVRHEVLGEVFLIGDCHSICLDGGYPGMIMCHCLICIRFCINGDKLISSVPSGDIEAATCSYARDILLAAQTILCRDMRDIVPYFVP